MVSCILNDDLTTLHILDPSEVYIANPTSSPYFTTEAGLGRFDGRLHINTFIISPTSNPPDYKFAFQFIQRQKSILQEVSHLWLMGTESAVAEEKRVGIFTVLLSLVRSLAPGPFPKLTVCLAYKFGIHLPKLNFLDVDDAYWKADATPEAL